MPIKTTIDANAPILMQWIVSSTDRLNKEAEPGRHPLPNTETFPHRQRLVNMAKVEPDRLICLYYLGDTLNEEQNKQMQDLEKLAPNIRAIDFNTLDWSEYDFEFDTNRLTSDLDSGKKMRMTEYLKLQNTDNRMGFRLDMMRILMLLKCPKAALLELNKVEAWDKPVGEGGVYFDFDYALKSKMSELQAPYSILVGYNSDPIKESHFCYANSVMAVTTNNNPVFMNAHRDIKNYLHSNQSGPYEEFLSDIKKYYSYDENFYKNERKAAPIIAGIIEIYEGIIHPSKCAYFLNNWKDYQEEFYTRIEEYAKDKKSKIPIDDCLDSAGLKLAIHNFQVFLAFDFVGNSMAKFIIDKAPVEIKERIKDAETMIEKYKLICEFLTSDKIALVTALHNNGVSMDSFVTDNKKYRSWVISEDAGINKFHGSNTTYTEIFEMMYKAPELEIKNIVSTNLKDVKQEQNKGYCIL